MFGKKNRTGGDDPPLDFDVVQLQRQRLAVPPLHAWSDPVAEGDSEQLAVRDETTPNEEQSDDGRLDRAAEMAADACLHLIHAAEASVPRNVEGKLRSTQKRFHAQVKDAEQAEARAYELVSGISTEFGEEFDLLSKVVDRVELSDTTLTVWTPVLFATHDEALHFCGHFDEHRHEVGAFRIVMDIVKDPDAKMFRVFFWNETRQVDYSWQYPRMNAPHVDQNGAACLGSESNRLQKLIGAREYADAVFDCISFLQSVNLDDEWGKEIAAWPIA